MGQENLLANLLGSKVACNVFLNSAAVFPLLMTTSHDDPRTQWDVRLEQGLGFL